VKAKKDLKIVGWVFLFLALVDVVNLLVDYFDGFYAVENIMDMAGNDVTESVAKIAAIIAISITVIAMLIKVFFGVKAIKQANGTTKSTSHIVLAKIILVISVILAVIMVISLIQNAATIFDLIVALANIVIYASYIQAAKLVQEVENNK